MQVKIMNLEDVDLVIPLYIDYYNNYEDSSWNKTTAKNVLGKYLRLRIPIRLL